MIAFVTLMAISCSFAQTREIDSLQQKVNNSKGTEKIDALNTLIFRKILVDFKLADEAIEESLKLSERENYTKGLAEANIYKGICELSRGNKKSALEFLGKGIRYAQRKQLKGLEGYALTQTGNLYRNAGAYDSAKYWYDQAYEILRDSANPKELSVVYRNLARLNSLIFKPQLEYQYLMKTYQIRIKLHDHVFLTDILLLLAQWHIKQGDFIKANEFLEQALKIKDNPPAVQDNISYQRAIVLFNEAQYLEGIKLLNDVTSSYLNQDNLVEYVKVTIDAADLLEELGSNDLSIKKCYEALDICKKKNFKSEELRVRTILGWNFYDTHQLPLARTTTEEVLKEAQQLKLEVEEAAAENLLGRILTEEKKYQEALYHYEKGLALRIEHKNHQGRAHILANMADTYFAMSQYKKAIGLIKKSIAIVDSLGGSSSASWDYVGSNYLRLSSIYIKMNDYDSALYALNYEKSKRRLTNNVKTRNTKEFQVNWYNGYREVLIGKGKIQEALEISLKIEQLKDSLNATSLSERIVSLQASYELDKQAQELMLRNDEITLQKAAIRQQQVIITAAIIVSLLLIILLYVSYRYYTRSRSLNQTLQEINKEVQAQKEELAKANQELNIINRQLADKNEEIQTQSEELTQSYATISKMNESLEQKVRDRTLQLQEAFKELDTFLYRSSHDFRRPLTTFMGLAEVAKISVSDKNALDLFEKVKETTVNLDRMLLKLQSISDVGSEQFVVKRIDVKSIFDSALKIYHEAISQNSIKVVLKTDVIDSFSTYPAFLKIIIDNLLENAIQFSKPNGAQIRLEAKSKDNGVEILVWDNGFGIEEEHKDRVFDMFFRGSQYSKGNGLGLYIVKKAVGKLEGNVSIESTYNVETKIKIWLPLKLS